MTKTADKKFLCGSKAEKRAGWWTLYKRNDLDIGLNLINLICIKWLLIYYRLIVF